MKNESDWHELTCLNENISLRLPQSWKRAGEEITASKFPYGIKQQEIFTDLEENKYLTFNIPRCTESLMHQPLLRGYLLIHHTIISTD